MPHRAAYHPYLPLSPPYHSLSLKHTPYTPYMRVLYQPEAARFNDLVPRYPALILFQ